MRISPGSRACDKKPSALRQTERTALCTRFSVCVCRHAAALYIFSPDERKGSMFTVQDLLTADLAPAPYAPGAEFWDDPYIASQLLQAHLDPDTDQASYKPQTIAALCDRLPAAMGLAAGASIVDLGCGPGLYCAALARRGYRITGIDRSAGSLAYAAAHAPGASFRRASYLQPFGGQTFDAALMISQDYGVLNPQQRQTLLRNIHAALKPGGQFAFDVPSLHALELRTAAGKPYWYTAPEGLFRPHPHAVLAKTAFYPALSALCDIYAVFDEQCTLYRFWQTFFSPDTLRAELAACGFAVQAVTAGLEGAPCTQTAPALGVICRKE